MLHRVDSPYEEKLRQFDSVQCISTPTRLRGFLRSPAASRATIFHAHTGNTVPIALWGARSRGHTVITRRLDLPIKPWMFRRAARVVAISRRVEQVLVSSGILPERLRLIPSAVDLERSLEAVDIGDLRRELAIAPDAHVGLTIGALTEQKDPMTLVAALPKLPPNYVHIWVGAGHLLSEAQRLAEYLGVKDRLRLTGFDSHPDRWFAIADLFVLPSIHEGLGTVLLDAFHFGVPVVGTAIPATSELLEHGTSALLFEPRDADGLAAAVHELLNNLELASRLSTEGSSRVTAYDARDMGERYVELYRELIDGPDAHHREHGRQAVSG